MATKRLPQKPKGKKKRHPRGAADPEQIRELLDTLKELVKRIGRPSYSLHLDRSDEPTPLDRTSMDLRPPQTSEEVIFGAEFKEEE
jgi:hypothetical protein